MRKMMGVISLAVLALFTGCSQSAEKGLEEFTVVLDWYPNAVHSFLYTALEKGYFEQEGLEVNIAFPANTNDAISLPAVGKADVGIYYLQDALLARGNEGVPVQSIGAVVQTPLNVIVSLEESNINSPKDLVGKQMGNGGSTVADAVISTIMEDVGESLDEVGMVDIGFDIISALTTKRVDAAFGCMLNHEVPELEEAGFAVNYFAPKDYGVPSYHELVLLASEKECKENPEKIAAFLRGCKKGFEDMKKDPAGSLGILLEHQNKDNFPLKASVEEKALEILLPTMEGAEAPFLSQQESVWQENIDWMREKGLLNRDMDAKEMLANIPF